MASPMPAYYTTRSLYSTTLATGVSSSDTQFVLTPGGGSRLPVPAGLGVPLGIYNSTDYATAEAADLASAHEWVICTAKNVDGDPDKITVGRGKFGSAAKAHNTAGKTYRIYMPVASQMLDAIGYCLPFGAILGGAVGDGTTDDAPALAATQALVPASGGEIYVGPSTYRISQNHTIGPGVTLKMSDGSKFSVADGVTLTLKCAIDCGRVHIFDGTGSIVFSDGNHRVDTILPEWFGFMPSETESDKTAQGQKWLDSIVSNKRTRRGLFGAGKYWAKNLKISTTDISMALSGLPKRSSQLIQVSTATATDDLLETNPTSGQRGPRIENLILQSHANGRHCLHIHNVQEAVVEDVQVTDGSQNGALLRVNGGCARCTFRNVRFHHTAGAGPKYLLHIGDGGAGFPQDTNNYFYHLCSYSLSAGTAFENATYLIFVDNATINLFECKFDGLRNAGTNFYMEKGRSCRLYNVGFEMQATCQKDFWIKDAIFVFMDRCAVGHPTEKPISLDLDNVQMFHYRDGAIFESDIQIDANCQAVVFDKAQIEQTCDVNGNAALIATLLTLYPRVIVQDSVLIDSTQAYVAGYLSGPANAYHLRKNSATELESPTSLKIGDGAWNGQTLRMGANYLWVDATGKLRIKSSAPTSDTDGTVVGAHT